LDELSTYFEYSVEIRKVIYITNSIEGMNRQIRKITKTKGAFTSDQSLLKLVYLAYRDFLKSGHADMELGLTMSQFHIKFGDRLKAFGDFFLGEAISLHLGRSGVDTVHFILPRHISFHF